MITELIFITGLAITLSLVVISFYWKNPAFCGVSIVLLLLLALAVVPGGTGVYIPSGKNISVVEDCNCTFVQDREGSDWTKQTLTTEKITYEKQTNLYLFLVLLLLAFYLILEITNFVKEEKEEQEQEQY